MIYALLVETIILLCLLMDHIHESLKGHGRDVSAYLRESVNSVGMVERTCTLYASQLDYQTVSSQVDYMYM